MQRIKQYSKVSTSLACLSNEKLKQVLADSKLMHEGIGGKSALISIDDIPVFVKKVPLTDLEQLPQHFMFTIFATFRAWRTEALLSIMAIFDNNKHQTSKGGDKKWCYYRF